MTLKAERYALVEEGGDTYIEFATEVPDEGEAEEYLAFRLKVDKRNEANVDNIKRLAIRSAIASLDEEYKKVNAGEGFRYS